MRLILVARKAFAAYLTISAENFSLTRIRARYGPGTFRRFFEEIVEHKSASCGAKSKSGHNGPTYAVGQAWMEICAKQVRIGYSVDLVTILAGVETQLI